jgi:hypothetical protein
MRDILNRLDPRFDVKLPVFKLNMGKAAVPATRVPGLIVGVLLAKQVVVVVLLMNTI